MSAERWEADVVSAVRRVNEARRAFDAAERAWTEATKAAQDAEDEGKRAHDRLREARMALTTDHAAVAHGAWIEAMT